MVYMKSAMVLRHVAEINVLSPHLMNIVRLTFGSENPSSLTELIASQYWLFHLGHRHMPSLMGICANRLYALRCLLMKCEVREEALYHGARI
jgi:hypothetical protein